MPDDVTVRVMDLPRGMHGAIVMDEEGHANIYIQARDSYDQQRITLLHEMRHYYRGDCYGDAPVWECERK